MAQTGLLICLLLTGTFIYISTSTGAKSVFAGDNHAESNRVLVQTSPLASPLALAQPAEQGESESAEDANAENAKPSVQQSAAEFQEQLPIYSGSRANQTSLVLIGAVLVGLVIVGTLVITRRD